MTAEFNALRLRARIKRDKEIAAIRQEYAETLAKIAVLEQDLLGRVPSKYKKITACIESVIPTDRTFTTADVMAGLEALDPGRVWQKRSIDNHISRLRERGIVKRLKRATLHTLAVYARADVPVESHPMANVTLRDALVQVVSKPMRTTEILVALGEAGYKSLMGRAALKNQVVKELGRSGFVNEGGKWMRR